MNRSVSVAFSVGMLLFALAAPPGALAQAGGAPEGRTGRWALSLAVSHQAVNDQIASPLRQAGLGPAVGVAYRSRGARSEWGGGISYGSPSLRPASGTDRTSSEEVHDFALDFSYLRRVSGAGETGLSVFIGVGTDIRLGERTHQYGSIGSETYADLFAPVEAQAMWRYAADGGGGFSGRIAAAAVSLVARDPYTGAKYAPGIELADPIRVPMLRHVLSYRFGMGSTFDGVLSHELTYLRYPEPRHMVRATQELRFALEWRR